MYDKKYKHIVPCRMFVHNMFSLLYLCTLHEKFMNDQKKRDLTYFLKQYFPFEDFLCKFVPLLVLFDHLSLFFRIFQDISYNIFTE